MASCDRVRRMARGGVLLEYVLAVCGLVMVALVSVAALSAKTGGQMDLVTGTALGRHPGDNGPIDAQPLVELTEGTGGGAVPWATPGLVVDFEQISANTDGTKSRLGDQLGSGEADPFGTMIINVFLP